MRDPETGRSSTKFTYYEEVVQRIRAYNRVGFHPDDNDNSELLDHWTAELFGADGQLADHLR